VGAGWKSLHNVSVNPRIGTLGRFHFRTFPLVYVQRNVGSCIFSILITCGTTFTSRYDKSMKSYVGETPSARPLPAQLALILMSVLAGTETLAVLFPVW